MNWDWDKLKKQQQSSGGGPPQMDEIISKLRNFKFPGGPILIIVILVLFLASSTFYTVGVDEVGVVQRFGKYTRTLHTYFRTALRVFCSGQQLSDKRDPIATIDLPPYNRSIS